MDHWEEVVKQLVGLATVTMLRGSARLSADVTDTKGLTTRLIDMIQ